MSGNSMLVGLTPRKKKEMVSVVISTHYKMRWIGCLPTMPGVWPRPRWMKRPQKRELLIVKCQMSCGACAF